MDGGAGVAGVLLNVGGDLRVAGEIAADDRHRRPLGGFGVVRADRTHRGQGPGGRHQRELPARVPDRGAMVLAHLRPAVRAAGRGVARATVIADRSADADALATICNVLSPEEGVPLVEVVPRGRMPDRRPATAGSRGATAGPIREAAAGAGSPGPRTSRPSPPGHLASPAEAEARAPAAAATPWGQEFELVVNFEINQPERARPAATAGRTWRSGSRTRTGFPVRNLVALGLDGRRRAVPVAARPETLVQGRPGQEAGRQEGHVHHDRPPDPARRAIPGDLGRQGRQRQAAPPPASTRSTSTPHASTGRIRTSART